MSRGTPRYAAKRDLSEPGIVAVFENHGWLVVKHDAYDLDVFPPGAKHGYPIECKTGRASLTESQKAMIAKGIPLTVLRSELDALAFVRSHT